MPRHTRTIQPGDLVHIISLIGLLVAVVVEPVAELVGRSDLALEQHSLTVARLLQGGSRLRDGFSPLSPSTGPRTLR